MSEGLKITLTAVVGIAVFVVGQIIQKWFIEPIQEQRKTFGEIVHALVFYANVDIDLTPKERIDEAQKQFRSLSSSLRKSLALIPCYRLLAFLRIVPSQVNILSASSELIGISNRIRKDGTHEAGNDIIRLLGLKYLQQRKEMRLL